MISPTHMIVMSLLEPKMYRQYEEIFNSWIMGNSEKAPLGVHHQSLRSCQAGPLHPRLHLPLQNENICENFKNWELFRENMKTRIE